MLPSLTTLLTQYPQHILYAVLTGSQAYGTATAESDEDIKGVFALPAQHYLSLDPPPKQLADEKNDVVYYSLQRLLELLSEANPNLLELLYSPADCVTKQSKAIQPLLDQRHHFVTLQCVDAHIGYAMAQVKKAKGQNKWINNPQPKTAPSRDQFCWVIMPDSKQKRLPMRPIALADTAILLDHCHCASLEHVPNTYRLYDYGKAAKGVFRKGTLVCESIAKDQEWQRFCGLLIFNNSAWQQAKREHKQYWQWRDHRNEARWRQQERGEIDYDAKNMMHTMRLLLSAEHILSEGRPKVRFSGQSLAFLRAIRAGKFSYEELSEYVTSSIHRCRSQQPLADLPKQVDRKRSERLLQEITQQWLDIQTTQTLPS